MFDKDRVCPLLRCALTCLEVCSWKHFLRGLTWRCCWQDGACCDMNWWRNSLRIRSHQATSEHSLTQQEALVLELSDVDADSVKKLSILDILETLPVQQNQSYLHCRAFTVHWLTFEYIWNILTWNLVIITAWKRCCKLQLLTFFDLISGDPGATWANWACLSVRGGVMAIKWTDTKWYIYYI